MSTSIARTLFFRSRTRDVHAPVGDSIGIDLEQIAQVAGPARQRSGQLHIHGLACHVQEEKLLRLGLQTLAGDEHVADGLRKCSVWLVCCNENHLKALAVGSSLRN